MKYILMTLSCLIILAYPTQSQGNISENLMRESLENYYYILLDIGYFPIPKYMFHNTRQKGYLQFTGSVYLVPDGQSASGSLAIKDSSYKITDAIDIDLNSSLMSIERDCNLIINYSKKPFQDPSRGIEKFFMHYITINDYILQFHESHVQIIFEVIDVFRSVNCSSEQ